MTIIDKIKEKFKEIDYSLLFLFDPDADYEEELHNYKGEAFKVLTVSDNYFQIKYEVEFREEEENILLYHKFKQPQTHQFRDYPLTDLLLAADVLAIDEVTGIMERYGIPRQEHDLIRRYKPYWRSKKNEKSLSPFFADKPFNADKLGVAVLSILLKQTRPGDSSLNIIQTFETLNKGEKEWEKAQEKIEKAGLKDLFLRELYSVLGLEVEAIDYDSLLILFQKIKYNALTYYIDNTIPEDLYARYKEKDNTVKTKIHYFFEDWAGHRYKARSLEDVLKNLGKEIRADKIIEAYGSDKSYGLRIKEVQKSILENIVKLVLLNPKEVLDKYGSWKNNPDDFEGFEPQMEFLVYAARFFNLKNNNGDLVFDRVEEYLDIYTKELYKLDLYYRRAFIAFKQFHGDKFPKFAELFEKLNNTYDQYIIDLNNPWVQELVNHSDRYKKSSFVNQYDFYKEFVEPITTKRVVIISDAFRYELADDLLNELDEDVQNEIEIVPMLSSIPSYTSLGMSNLLPNKGITPEISEDNIDYSIDGIKTISTNRERILQLADENAITINFDQFDKLNKSQGRELLRGKNTVYIYHDWMDNIGDKRASEYHTLLASEQCIEQLVPLIKRLYDTYGFSNVLLTADHGFLYNHQKISEATSQPGPKLNQTLKEHARFYLTQEENTSSDTYEIPLSATTNMETDVKVIMPKSINRFRKQGNYGVQFVHGGCSLQEVVVPVFQLKRLNQDSAVEVAFVRVDTTAVITTSTTKFSFLQSEAVGEKYKPSNIVFGLYSVDQNLVSTETEIHFNSIKENASERQFDIRLDLTEEGAGLNLCYLKAFRKSDKDRLNPVLNTMIKIKMSDLDIF